MANDIIDIIVTDNSDNVQLNVTPNLVSINVSQTSGNIIGSNYYLASTFSALPITGDLTTLYVINDTSLMYRWSGSAYTQINSSAVVAWGQITGTLSGQTDLQNALNAKAPLASPTFTGTVSGITKSMVGLSNVDNTSDVNKPISTATQTALNLKADINNPTFTGTVGGITKAMVGLGNVDNTSDVNKPISSATQTALDTKAPLASPTFTGTVSGITKSMVGLGNVDNTTDLLKPISTATQSALNLKYDASNPAGYTTNVGTVTSVGGTGTVSGLSLSGSVTTSGNLTLGGTLSLTSGNVTTALGYTPYNATNPSGYISGITSGQVTTALGYTPENSANKGIANGYASLDGGGLVPSTQLPSYVDDVLEFANLAAFPASGTTGKIYVALDTNKIYRWSGATYIEVSPTVGTIWGGITGTLSNQTDLQNALNAKQNNLSGTGFVKSTAGTISYDTATYYPYPTGDTTQYVGGDGSLISFPIAGQSGTIVRLVRNNTGATLTKGTVIYISGATGNNPVVSKAIATGDATSAQTFGLCQANIANNATGYVVVMGDLIGLDTSAFTEGQQVYLSGTVAGTFTATKQYAPIHLVYIGVITRAHPTLGQIEVKIQNGYELDEIHNVSAQSPANNDIIAFNTSNSLWEKKSIATALGFTPYNATNPNNYIALTALSSSATGLTYTNTTGVFSLTAGYEIPTSASATNWDSAYTNRITSLTTTGSSGSATLVSNVLNIPTYTLSGLGGQVALNGTGFVKISGTTISYDNSTYLTTASASSTYQTIITNPVTGTGTINELAYFNSASSIASLPVATYPSLTELSYVKGVTSAIQTQINTKQATISLTTTGTSGAATFSANTLNIPNYGSALSGYLPLTGGTLTGALGGTSASFSGLLSGGNTSPSTSYNAGSWFTGDGLVAGNISSVCGIQINSSTTSTLSAIRFGDGDGANNLYDQGFIIYRHTTDSMLFGANRSTALTLASTGAATFSSSVTSDDLILTAGALFSAGNTGFSNRLSDTTLYLQMPATGFNITDNALNTRFILSSAGQLTSTKTSGIFLNNSSGGTNAVQLQINNTSGDLRLGIESSTGDTIQAGTSAYAAVFGNQANNATQFTTNGNVRMTITSGGQIGIGTSNPFGLSSSLLAISGNGNTYNLVNIQDTVNQNNCAFLQCLNASGVGIGEIRRIGTTNAVAFNTTSDYRLKEDFREIKGLEKISAIKVYDFKWKDNEFRMDGVLAHELQEIIPFAVTGDKDEVNNDGSIKTQGVDYSKIVPVLIKAIQELSAKVSLLENK